MMRFAKVFTDFEILSTPSTKLSWSHFCEIMRVKTEEGRLFYIQDSMKRNLGVRTLRRLISRKTFERQEIANAQLSDESTVPFNTFKDPFLLDVLDLKDNYLEADIEQAICTDFEKFFLEFGHGLTFVARQKKMTIDGEDSIHLIRKQYVGSIYQHGKEVFFIRELCRKRRYCYEGVGIL